MRGGWSHCANEEGKRAIDLWCAITQKGVFKIEVISNGLRSPLFGSAGVQRENPQREKTLARLHYTYGESGVEENSSLSV